MTSNPRGQQFFLVTYTKTWYSTLTIASVPSNFWQHCQDWRFSTFAQHCCEFTWFNQEFCFHYFNCLLAAFIFSNLLFLLILQGVRCTKESSLATLRWTQESDANTIMLRVERKETSLLVRTKPVLQGD